MAGRPYNTWCDGMDDCVTKVPANNSLGAGALSIACRRARDFMYTLRKGGFWREGT